MKPKSREMKEKDGFVVQDYRLLKKANLVAYQSQDMKEMLLREMH